MSKCLEKVYVPKIEHLRTTLLVKALQKAVADGPLRHAFRLMDIHNVS